MLEGQNEGGRDAVEAPLQLDGTVQNEGGEDSGKDWRGVLEICRCHTKAGGGEMRVVRIGPWDKQTTHQNHRHSSMRDMLGSH